MCFMRNRISSVLYFHRKLIHARSGAVDSQSDKDALVSAGCDAIKADQLHLASGVPAESTRPVREHDA
jgi:hypothetical protein